MDDTVIDLIDKHFDDDIADELTLGEGTDDLTEAILGSAEHHGITPENAVVRLLVQLTGEDRQYLRGELDTLPAMPGSWLAAKIEEGTYI